MPDDPTAATPSDVPVSGDPTPPQHPASVPADEPAGRLQPASVPAGELSGRLQPASVPVGDPSGTLHVPLSPVGADRVRWVAVAVILVGSLGLLAAYASGTSAALVVTLVLALATAWGWPTLSGSATPGATSVVLAVSSVPVVLSALRDDLRWVAAAVAFGIVLSFVAQLRRSSREGLVLTLMASFGGLALIASGATGLAASAAASGRQVAVVAFAAVAAAVLADLLVAVRVVTPVLALVALVAAAVASLVVGSLLDGVGAAGALGAGLTAGTASWSLRRVLALEPAMTTVRGQVGAATGSVLAVGALVHLFSVVA